MSGVGMYLGSTAVCATLYCIYNRMYVGSFVMAAAYDLSHITCNEWNMTESR